LVSFFSKKGKGQKIFLEDGIVKGMSMVASRLKSYVGFDVLKSNATHLKAIVKISEMAGLAENPY